MEKTSILVSKTDFRAGNEFKPHMHGDVGLDLEVWEKEEETYIQPFSFATLHTGLKIKVDENSWGMIRPRSSTFFKRKLLVMEGTIDSGYTGDMFINVFNPTSNPVIVKNGDRLAQLIPIPRFMCYDIKIVLEMPKTERGENKFGSTGGISE